MFRQNCLQWQMSYMTPYFVNQASTAVEPDNTWFKKACMSASKCSLNTRKIQCAMDLSKLSMYMEVSIEHMGKLTVV